ncbi:hypothetical protein EG327_009055 [Venturia inaequalis]|uniref:Secreted protein n=1 Tax=Venturia inaequalis TaxID=5025 RepID=A0A8H3VRC8_VENIN|nr:hypothetical protein EG327_009055 [Venturia inaequalis]
MNLTTIIAASLALLRSTIMALPQPDDHVAPAEGIIVPINQGPNCQGNSGLNLFNGIKGTGKCDEYSISNDGTCMRFNPFFNIRSVHLADGAQCILYSSKTCKIESKDDHKAPLLHSVDDLFADQAGSPALTFYPRGWKCYYWPPKAASVPVARSLDTTADAHELAPGTLMLCNKAKGLGNCGIWSFKNNNCVSIADDFTIVSIYIDDKTQCWIYNNRVCNTDLSLNDKWAPLLKSTDDVIADGLGYNPHSWKCVDRNQ